jgi:hypothetical protein
MRASGFFGRRNRQGFDGGRCPFFSHLNEHNGDIIADGVFAFAVLAYEPVIIANEVQDARVLFVCAPGFSADAIGATQNF